MISLIEMSRHQSCMCEAVKPSCHSAWHSCGSVTNDPLSYTRWILPCRTIIMSHVQRILSPKVFSNPIESYTCSTSHAYMQYSPEPRSLFYAKALGYLSNLLKDNIYFKVWRKSPMISQFYSTYGIPGLLFIHWDTYCCLQITLALQYMLFFWLASLLNCFSTRNAHT